ncbi:hypothetical protein EIP91_003950 [Steccherinum ochraceum]|uniref:Peptidase C14 caspase domain-containing protein n=1 Tax=Steccherinum ochraceum TaxID=92696 RepID=A0A4R0RNS5_9APHY|nr:hypothetical protein EIP91_003950 [Steccherinum ochraceum]
MSTRLFALIIGVDKYKSGNIWDLETCVDDAHSIKHWLTHDLHVPRSQICLLTNEMATQRAIEESFMSHLVTNPAIERDDAILIYFAGHGSSIRAPRGWFEDGSKEVELLCPYDHDMKSSSGRVAGISDRSLHAMIQDLSEAKGNNITLIFDSSFSAPTSRVALRERRHSRWTPTTKATSDDLHASLWRNTSTGSPSQKPIRGFARIGYDSHIVIAACGHGQSAIETKGGGNFTQAFIAAKDSHAIHHKTYAAFMHDLENIMGEGQRPVCVGIRKQRILFNGVPFAPDARYISTDVYGDDTLRVDAGAIHGVADGTEFSLHDHNCRGSRNPSLATLTAVEIHPTWCLARSKSNPKSVLRGSWAQITRWNNRIPFQVHIRHSLFTLFRRCRVKREISRSTSSGEQRRPGVNMLHVKTASQADVSVKLHRREMVVERHDAAIASNCRRIIKLSSEQTSTDMRILDAAAHFHLHLHRKNPQKPLLGLVTMGLYRLDSGTWTRVSGNLLVDGRAQIVDDEKDSIYSVVLHNYSDVDLYPYLAYMDASGYGINMIYHPDARASVPPLRKHSHLVIGSGTLDSEALSFTLADGADTGAGFLKLFVCSEFTPMTFIEQGPPTAAPISSSPPAGKSGHSSRTELWDSVVACVTVVRKQL